jgi:hypothetical protein
MSVHPSANGPVASDQLRPCVSFEGSQVAFGGTRFPFRGVTYGTFAARADGALFPVTDWIRQDAAGMSAAGFTVVRICTPPPDDLLDTASQNGLKVLAGLFYKDGRYLLGTGPALVP